MSCAQCDQAQLTHLRTDVGLPPTGPNGPAKSQSTPHPQGVVRGLVGQKER